MHCGVYNYVTLFELNQNIFAKVDDAISKSVMLIRKLSTLKPAEISQALYPDRVRNSPFVVLAILDYPFMFTRNNKYFSKYFSMLDAFKEVFNSSHKISVLSYESLNETEKIVNARKRKRQYDLALMNIVAYNSVPKLLTYEKEGICVLVPKIPTISGWTLQPILLQPFQTNVWLIWLAGLVIAALCWKLLKRQQDSSSLRFLYVSLIMIVGQLPNVRSTRRVLRILFQMIVISSFFFKNVYEGIVTSTMITKLDYKRFQTFEQLLESEIQFKFSLTRTISLRLAEVYNLKYDYVRSRFKIEDKLQSSYVEMAKENCVFLTTCTNAEYLMTFNESVQSYYYILPHELLSHYRFLDVGVNSNFVEKWQDVMNHAFQTGLQNAWNMFHKLGMSNAAIHLDITESDTTLTIVEILHIFIQLLFLHAVATVVLLLEIFYHDFVKNLSWKLLLRRNKRKNIVKPKVNIIQVRPVESGESFNVQ